MKIRATTIAAAAVLVLPLAACGGGASSTDGGEFTPDGDVTMLVPFAAGGGSDVAGRTTAAMIESVEPDLTVSVENRDGGSGAVGYAAFQGNAGTAETLLATETALLALPAGGNVDWTHEDFTPIMKLGEDFTLLVVPADSPLETCTDVVDASKSERVVAGISGQYGLDNVVFSLTEQKAGAKFDRVSFESGGELIAALLGDQIDIASLNPAEVIGQLESGDLKALCAYSEERYSYGALQDIPTAKEQGIDVAFAQFRGVLAPGDITEEQRDYWIGVMEKAVKSPEYDAYIEENYMQPVTAAGDEFVDYLGTNKQLLETAMGQ